MITKTFFLPILCAWDGTRSMGAPVLSSTGASSPDWDDDSPSSAVMLAGFSDAVGGESVREGGRFSTSWAVSLLALLSSAVMFAFERRSRNNKGECSAAEGAPPLKGYAVDG